MQAPPAAALLVAPDAGDAAIVEVAAGQAFPVLDGPAAGRAAEELAAGLASALAAAPGDAEGTSATVGTEHGGVLLTLALHMFVAIASTDGPSASAGGSSEPGLGAARTRAAGVSAGRGAPLVVYSCAVHIICRSGMLLHAVLHGAWRSLPGLSSLPGAPCSARLTRLSTCGCGRRARRARAWCGWRQRARALRRCWQPRSRAPCCTPAARCRRVGGFYLGKLTAAPAVGQCCAARGRPAAGVSASRLDNNTGIALKVGLPGRRRCRKT